tara:strand:+ start:589 stop:801 length:213 start_codon:yes stop_codon:yes gene_type:complete
MKEATAEELKESIEALTSYRNRLKEEVIAISQKLRMPEEKIHSTLKDNIELRRIDKVIKKLSIEIDRKIK